MPQNRGLLRVIRASYRLHGDNGEWLSRVAQCLAGVAGAGMGSISFRFRVASQCFRPWEITLLQPCSLAHANMLLDISAHASSQLKQRFQGMGTRCGSLSETGLLDISEITGRLRDRVGDAINFVVFEPDGEGCAFLFPAPHRLRLHTRTERSWQKLLVHIAAGLRLRRLRAAEILDSVDSLLGRDKRAGLETRFAQGTWSVRDILRLVAVAADQALAHRDNGSDALIQEVYQGLLAGRWTFIDHFDHNGRRFVIARRVEAQASMHLRITNAELTVLRHAMDHSGDNQEGIARALGRSTSHVANHLARALSKIGVRNRAELIAAWRVKLDP